MSKVKKYIEDAVSAAVKEIKTKGVEVSNCNISNPTTVNVDNGDLTDVLLQLAMAQTEIARAVVEVSKSKPDINNNSLGMSFTGVDNSPTEFKQD